MNRMIDERLPAPGNCATLPTSAVSGLNSHRPLPHLDLVFPFVPA